MSPDVRRASAVAALIVALAALLWFRPPAGDDAYHHAIAAVEQVHAWKGGSWWPRFHPDWNGGTGSFLPTAFAPLAICVDGGLAAVVGEGTRAIGLALVLGLALGVLAMRTLAPEPERSLAWVWIALPYVLTAVLARASVTEVWALAGAAGIVLLALPPGPGSVSRSVMLAGLIALVSGFQVAMLVLIAWVVGMGWLAAGSYREVRKTFAVAGWMGLGVLVGAVLWVPLVMDVQFFARGELVEGWLDWRRRFLLPPSENGPLAPALIAVSVSLLAVVAMAMATRRSGSRRVRALIGVIVGSVFLATPLAMPLWYLPGMAGLQFPWRFLGLGSIAGLALAAHLEGRWRAWAVTLLVLPVVLIPVHLDAGRPKVETSADGDTLALRAHVRYGVVETLPTYAGNHSVGFDRVESLRALDRQGESVRTVTGRSGFREFVVDGSGGRVLLPLQWWPEWRVKVDGAAEPFDNRLGLVAIAVDAGSHRVEVRLAPSRSRRVGAALSAVGIALLLIVALPRRRQRLTGD